MNKVFVMYSRMDVSFEGRSCMFNRLSCSPRTLTKLSCKGSVNRGLKKIDRLLIPYFDKDHGDNLSVTRVYPKTKVVRGGTSTKDAIADQRRLSEGPLNGERESGLEYGTIACCKYRKADGTYAWRIIIPGTDGNHDSPMDWYTNFELMSADERQRGTAESLRFLDETMKSPRNMIFSPFLLASSAWAYKDWACAINEDSSLSWDAMDCRASACASQRPSSCRYGNSIWSCAVHRGLAPVKADRSGVARGWILSS